MLREDEMYAMGSGDNEIMRLGMRQGSDLAMDVVALRWIGQSTQGRLVVPLLIEFPSNGEGGLKEMRVLVRFDQTREWEFGQQQETSPYHRDRHYKESRYVFSVWIPHAAQPHQVSSQFLATTPPPDGLAGPGDMIDIPG
jgi:hypothetical protein